MIHALTVRASIEHLPLVANAVREAKRGRPVSDAQLALDLEDIYDSDIDLHYAGTIFRLGVCDVDAAVRDMKAQLLGTRWYIILYHECRHDVPQGSPCPKWVIKAEKGRVPELLRV